jgi:hypothetical protein
MTLNVSVVSFRLGIVENCRKVTQRPGQQINASSHADLLWNEIKQLAPAPEVKEKNLSSVARFMAERWNNPDLYKSSPEINDQESELINEPMTDELLPSTLGVPFSQPLMLQPHSDAPINSFGEFFSASQPAPTTSRPEKRKRKTPGFR